MAAAHGVNTMTERLFEFNVRLWKLYGKQLCRNYVLSRELYTEHTLQPDLIISNL